MKRTSLPSKFIFMLVMTFSLSLTISGCSSSSLENQKETCKRLQNLASLGKSFNALLVSVNGPSKVNWLPKKQRENVHKRILEFYPFLDNSLPNSEFNDQTLKNQEYELFSWALKKYEPGLFSVEKHLGTREIATQLFGGDEKGNIADGPCGKGKGLQWGTDSVVGPYLQARVALLKLNKCSPSTHCFDSLTPLQEICISFQQAREEMDLKPWDGYLRNKFLSVEERLKSSPLSETDSKAITRDLGYGKFSISDVALGINKFAYGFGEDNRFYHFEGFCSTYLP